MYMFKKNQLIIVLAAESIAWIFFISVRFALVQLMSSHPFPLPGGASPPADIVILLRRVTLLFHGGKMSSLPPLHLSAMLHVSPNSYTPLAGYKNVILTLATFPTIQLRLHFVFSVVRVPRRQSSTCRRRSLSPPSNSHYPSAQR
jgi:hypothetical protein